MLTRASRSWRRLRRGRARLATGGARADAVTSAAHAASRPKARAPPGPIGSRDHRRPRRAGRRTAAAALLLGAAAAADAARAQRAGCGLGLGLEAMRAADRTLAQAPRIPSLAAGRATAAAAADRLHGAAAALSSCGCGCARAAADAEEAAALADAAGSEASVARVAAALDRARFSLRLARERLDRDGCS